MNRLTERVTLAIKSRLHHSSVAYDFAWAMFLMNRSGLARKSKAWWREHKDAHYGQRGFVIGNGPSLKFSDLDSLQGEVCIASNKIYLAYPHTVWRPSYLTCSDKLVWSKIQEDLPGKTELIFALSTMDMSLARVPVVVFRHRGSIFADNEGFSFDSTEGQYGGRTVTYHNLQMAVHLGLNPIYLIGCDHYYQGEQAARNGGQVVHAGQQNHFVPNYRQPGEKVNMAPMVEMNAAYKHAAKKCSERGIKILNATRGGHLEAFPRVDLANVLAKEKREQATAAR
jgi:hypothetical protein